MFNPLKPSDYSAVYMCRNAESWKVVGSNSHKTIEYFNLSNSFSHTTSVAFNQLLTYINTRRSL
jgi:hypothetical protein